jgi:2-dehydropantoate 2-reductase
MRFVVFGAGAIGGVVGARLHQGGHRVTLVARGAHYEAIRDHGLTLEEPDERAVLAIDVAASPAGIDWSGDEVVLLATKSQDTGGALRALRAAAPPATAIVCMQNGVENERLALRLFENVYGAVVMVPAAHTEPGTVEAHATKLTGIIDVGRYPDGTDERCEAIVEALESSRFSSFARHDVMRRKHAKLVLNLANAVGAISSPGPAAERLIAAAQAEGRAALTAAGIAFEADDVADVTGRWERLGVRTSRRSGSSTWQSLQRRTGAVESDYLNGEIVLRGPLHGVPTPVNAVLARLADRVAREGAGPRTLDAEQILAEAGDASAAWTR